MITYYILLVFAAFSCGLTLGQWGIWMLHQDEVSNPAWFFMLYFITWILIISSVVSLGGA